MATPNSGKDKDKSVAALTPPATWIESRAADPAAVEDGGGFAPGTVFAGRYQMISLVGRGAMGVVWQAEDLVLQTPVALKLIAAPAEDARERIVREVRLARQITHPAVCRVFDVGESDGHVFYSMELVPGEDLATLLRRIGRLPSEKVADIGVQLCGGLAAAHAQGVLHRDLKPANVLIDADGLVRITDFGIAVTRREPGLEPVAGTPGYMAPEQLAGLPVSERTDIYAVGVVLYELLTGQRPAVRAHHRADPVRPSSLVPGVDHALEHIVLDALASEPDCRPASASVMGTKLAARLAAPRPRLALPRWAVAAAAVAAAALGIAALLVIPRTGRALSDTDTIVLSEFLNTTGEPVFDGALEVALAVALEQSPFLKVFPDERVRETLRLLEQPAETRVTRAIARDIARREQLKALVAGSIARLGSHYVLTLEAVKAETGDVMAREQVEVPEKEQVLRALGGATSKLRERLGESLASIEKFDAPLPRATTASLDALHAYALALDEGRVNPRREAIPHLERAIEIDPSFALAQALLSGVYANTGQSSRAPEFSRRAFDLRDRVSERERFFISWRYYVDAAQAWDKALDLAESWTATYPREAFAFNSLGLASAAFGQHEQAIDAFRRAIALDPRFVPPYGNLVGSLTALNRFDEAEAAVSDARRANIDGTSLQRAAYLLPFVRGDAARMAEGLRAARASSSVAGASIWEARAAMFGGRFAEAHRLFEQGVRSATAQDLPEVAAQWTIENAEAYGIAGDCREAARQAAAGLAVSRDNFSLERGSRTFALCGDAAMARRLLEELSTRFPEAILTERLQRAITGAAVALQRDAPKEALELLAAAQSYDHAPSAEFWPAYLRGTAYLRLEDGRSARLQFESILAHRGEAPTSPLFALAQLGAARAAALEGDEAAAHRAYAAFLSLWSGADPMLPQLAEARREQARLR